MKPPAAALSASSSSRRWVLSMCSLASVFLLSTCITLIAAGHRPFQPRTPATTWDHFSKVLKAVPAAAPAPVHRSHSACSSSSSSPGGFDWNDHQEEADEEDAGAPAPAPAAAEDDDDECDVFDGEWVEDPVGYPLYDAAECPFLGDQVACHRNGRPDSGYERWRWQPSGCGGRTRVLGGAEALEACRDRRVVFVGDSLNRNMWESLACILYAAVPDRSRTRIVDVAGFKYRIFQATDYNCSVEFMWSPFLVNLETKDDGTKVLKLDQLSAMLQRALGANVLVFNTGHWWAHTGKLRAWDNFERDGKKVEMAGGEAFNRALRTWARWVDSNIDPSRTRVFFRSVSPEHKSVYWCYNQTSPISSGTVTPRFPKSLVTIVERNIMSMRTPVTYLNITHLSEFRIDAHPSIYTTTREGKPLSMEQQQQPLAYADCSHWCLPGLPDTWNVLLLYSLIRPPSNLQLLR